MTDDGRRRRRREPSSLCLCSCGEVLLPGIVERLEAICREEEAPDPARLYGLLVDLFGAFAELAANAGRYMTDLAVETAEIARDDDHFLAYKQAVFVYLNEFVSRLAEVVSNVARLVLAGAVRAAGVEVEEELSLDLLVADLRSHINP